MCCYITPFIMYILQRKKTALHYASMNGKSYCLKVLLEVGANKESKDMVSIIKYKFLSMLYHFDVK